VTSARAISACGCQGAKHTGLQKFRILIDAVANTVQLCDGWLRALRFMCLSPDGTRVAFIRIAGAR